MVLLVFNPPALASHAARTHRQATVVFTGKSFLIATCQAKGKTRGRFPSLCCPFSEEGTAARCRDFHLGLPGLALVGRCTSKQAAEDSEKEHGARKETALSPDRHTLNEVFVARELFLQHGGKWRPTCMHAQCQALMHLVHYRPHSLHAVLTGKRSGCSPPRLCYCVAAAKPHRAPVIFFFKYKTRK